MGSWKFKRGHSIFEEFVKIYQHENNPVYGNAVTLIPLKQMDDVIITTTNILCEINYQQVDILISKNQTLQILYLKHCVYKTT